MFQLFKKILENIIVFMGKMTCYSSCCSNINVKVVEKEPKPEKAKPEKAKFRIFGKKQPKH